MEKEQKGFGVLEALLILVIVGLIGFVGWYVWDSKYNANSSYDNASSTNQTPVVKKPKVAKNTIAIKELGIQFDSPDDLKNLTYAVITVDYSDSGNNDLGSYPTAYLSTEEFDNPESGKCSIRAPSVEEGTVPPLGFLTKTGGQYPENSTADNSTGNLIKQFPSYYISWRSPGIGCFSSSSTNEKAGTLSDELVATLKNTIQEIK